MIENILILDTETTGLSPDKGDRVIELGAVLYNLKTKAVLQSFSTLYPCDKNPVGHINLITPEMTKCKMSHVHVMALLNSMINESQAIVAHNAAFDRKFVLNMPIGSIFSLRKWICTKNDFKWPMQLYRNRLQDICEAMGVSYIDAHRALTDCNLLAQCFSKCTDLYQRFQWIGDGNQFISEKYNA